MSLFFRLFVLMLSVSLLPVPDARAQQHPFLAEWQTSLANLSCDGQAPTPFDLDTVIALSAAFARRDVPTMAEAANFSLTEYILNGNRIRDANQGDIHAERFLAANSDSGDALRAAIETHQQALCPVLEYIAGKGLFEILETQVNVRSYYQPQSELAQFLLNMHGCDAGQMDGLFGPGSRLAWNLAAANSDRVRSLRDGEVPGPADVVALAHAPATPGLCKNSPENLAQFLSTLSACKSGAKPLKDPASLGKKLADITGPDKRWRSDAFERILSPFWQTCEGKLQSGPDAFFKDASYAGEVLLLAFIGAHDPVPVTVAELDKTARALLRAISDPAVGSWEKPRDSADILREVGVALVLGQNIAPQPEFGLWLIAVSSNQSDFLRGSPTTIASAYLDGILPVDMSPSVAPALNRLLSPVFSPNELSELEYTDPDAQDRKSVFPDAAPETPPWWLPEGDAIPTFATIGLDFNTPLSEIHDAVSQARRAAEDPTWADLIRVHGSAAQNARIATLLIEGFVSGGKQVDLALLHFQSAADKGNSYAMLRLAQMHEQGYGVTRNPDKAILFYQQAADAGQPAAMLALAEAYETSHKVAQDWDKALDLYQRGLGLASNPASPIQGVEIAIGRRLMAGSRFFDDGLGRDLLDDLLAASGNTGPSYLPWSGDVGLAMGDMFAGLRQSHSVDLQRAADWYRASTSIEAEQRLLRLLWARPNLARTTRELRDLAEGHLLALWLDNPDPQGFRAALSGRCKFTDPDYTDCAEFLRQAAIGSFDTALISPAYDWLVQEAAAAQRYRSLVAADPYSDKSYILNSNQSALPANAALVDVLAFYGDFDGARSALLPLKSLMTSDGSTASAARDIALRQSLRRYLENGDAEAWRPVARLLRALAERGDSTAREFQSLAASSTGILQPVRLDLDTARTRFDKVEERGAATPSFSFSARRLSQLEGTAGNIERAVELELIAMRGDFSRHSVAQVWLGPVPSALARVCTLSRGSERLFELDQKPLALALAKQAVNELQALRADLIELPEHLQLCFRDHMSNHYRWLADLFIRQNRPSEAAAVLNMLKSFETFEYVGRDTDYGQAGFKVLALIPEENALIEAATQVAALAANSMQQRRDLNLRQSVANITNEETLRREQLNVELEHSRRRALENMQRSTAQVRALDTAAGIEPDLTIRRLLRETVYGQSAMVLQYLVLPDRLGIVLTTKDSQRSFVRDHLPNGQPFSEVALNAKINAFRGSLSHQNGDPDPLGAELFEILFPPELTEEIQKAGGDTLVLSLDGQLRFLPFAALRDDNGYLIERFTLTHATEARLAGSIDGEMGRISAFGATRNWENLGALPGVAIELDRLVISEEGDNGVVPGDTFFDDDFTLTSFTNALSAPDRKKTDLGIVHLASHFVLGPTQDESFLMMGDGTKLSVSEIRQGLGIGLNFNGVGLLTLSACNTAFGGTDNDGRELESFAAVAQQKGAGAVVATLWQVGDISNALLMERMYDHLINKQTTPAQALASAQRAFLAGGDILRGGADPNERYSGASHPYYWALIVVLEGAE
ncbi:CHAT domain-containing protein [Parasedimentitalea marina]|uniref:CHAT domain-containing protein n=1 Tax=Parasedimentitalea marina TaxID=2483033 RepID=A0A3T0MYT1_9RHOB|nr:CHAT domain-containing protein [Parasedimentitalea marina]AZV76902.1 CHAT domain-containing protein [Parasedimentitalea marina]